MSHRFPNPQRNLANFKLWISIIDDGLNQMDPLIVYEKKRVCIDHFDSNDCSPGTKRLKFNAVPHLSVPSTSNSGINISRVAFPDNSTCPSPSTSGINISRVAFRDNSPCPSSATSGINISRVAFPDNSTYYEDGEEEPDSITADRIYAGIQLSNKLEKHFLEIDTNSQRSLKFQKELRSCMSGYRDVYKKLTKRSPLQKFIIDFTATKNKSSDIASSSDESDFEPIRHKKVHVLDYDE